MTQHELFRILATEIDSSLLMKPLAVHQVQQMAICIEETEKTLTKKFADDTAYKAIIQYLLQNLEKKELKCLIKEAERLIVEQEPKKASNDCVRAMHQIGQ